jgi:transcription elongation GreA/GreB family factor
MSGCERPSEPKNQKEASMIINRSQKLLEELEVVIFKNKEVIERVIGPISVEGDRKDNSKVNSESCFLDAVRNTNDRIALLLDRLSYQTEILDQAI